MYSLRFKNWSKYFLILNFGVCGGGEGIKRHIRRWSRRCFYWDIIETSSNIYLKKKAMSQETPPKQHIKADVRKNGWKNANKKIPKVTIKIYYIKISPKTAQLFIPILVYSRKRPTWDSQGPLGQGVCLFFLGVHK